MRSLTFVAVLAGLALGAAATAAFADSYEIDPDHTEVRFTWDHLGLSRQGGRFTAVSGKLAFDPEQPAASRVEVTIPVKSLSTGIKKLDEQLTATKDFFDVATHPTITFKSSSVGMKSDRTADVAGELTMNGVTRPVVLDVVWNFTGLHPLEAINPVYTGRTVSGFSATTQIRRSDWGITRGAPLVSDEIRITIETEMLRVGPAIANDGAKPLDLLGEAGDKPAGTTPATPATTGAVPGPGPSVGEAAAPLRAPEALPGSTGALPSAAGPAPMPAMAGPPPAAPPSAMAPPAAPVDLERLDPIGTRASASSPQRGNPANESPPSTAAAPAEEKPKGVLSTLESLIPDVLSK